MYITGGIGAQGSNEGFGKDYDLPNETAYCETCASVGMVFWNQRMNMLTGESKYIDVLERSLYNAALDGVSLSGDRFFYGNPLASSGQHSRREWYGTACCPSNIARLISSLGNYVYSYSDNAVWVNLYIGSEVRVPFKKQALGLSMQTGYPWKGNTTLAVTEAGKDAVQLKLRIPGWLSQPVPGDLYQFTDGLAPQKMEVSLNGKPVSYKEENGYAVIERKWKKGDIIEINTPLEVRRIGSHANLLQNKDRVALQYGPMVYCVEAADNNNSAMNFVVPADAQFKVQYEAGKLGGVNTIEFDANVVEPSADGKQVVTVRKPIKAVPYFSWNNRGQGEMQVWLPTSVKHVKVAP
ncbi:MAG TPA: beta-L-arabinofuranosidase domain-containing protein, partial [Flavihumibacter sp.]